MPRWRRARDCDCDEDGEGIERPKATLKEKPLQLRKFIQSNRCSPPSVRGAALHPQLNSTSRQAGSAIMSLLSLPLPCPLDDDAENKSSTYPLLSVLDRCSRPLLRPRNRAEINPKVRVRQRLELPLLNEQHGTMPELNRDPGGCGDLTK
jgi:hypothetical protein